MKIGPRELLFLIVLIAVPVMAYMYVFRPQNAEIETAKLEIQHKESELSQLASETARIKDLENEHREIRAQIDGIESRLPSDKDVDKILEQVADIARKNNLKLPKFKTDKPVRYAAYYELPLEMKLVGQFSSFYGFMLDLENLERITRMPDLDIKRSDKEEGGMEATFTLSIFFQSEDEGGSA
ncbi:MAG: type 4a pilus biogenesis protein PilO [Phycisphaerales bacterium JB043]